MWDLPEPEIEPVSLALAGGFLTTGSAGTSLQDSFFFYFSPFPQEVQQASMFWCLQGRGPGLGDLVPAPRTQGCLWAPGLRTQAGLKDVLETQALWALF